MKKEKVVHKGKSRIWIGSIIAALVAAVAVFLIMMQMEKNLLTQHEKSNILVAAVEIPEGQLITAENRGTYFAEMELDKNVIPDTALLSVEQVEDMVAVATIEKGVLLTGGMFEEVDEIIAPMRTPVIAGFKADDLYQVVGGVLRAGDRIHIYNVDEEGVVTLSWSNVYVQQVFDNAGVKIVNGDEVTSAQRINVYMDNADIEQFYSKLAEGSLRVVKVCD